MDVNQLLTMHSSIYRLAAGSAAAAIGISATPGVAAVYQALCNGGSECTVTLANGQIGTPGLVIQKDQVLSRSTSSMKLAIFRQRQLASRIMSQPISS